MAVQTGMFVFEVAIEKLQCLSKIKTLVVRADFADVFSLELKDPNAMHIVIPEPPPEPPEPPGKKKKKPPPKKKGKEPPPPPEPRIQVGQSILFTSSPEFIMEQMEAFPLELSVWSADKLASELIGSVRIAWDPVYLSYLQDLFNCKRPKPPTVCDEYNIFEDGVPKIIAKVMLQVKLTYMTDRMESSFRSLSEDTAVRKYLFTGMNSRKTSYICTLKTSDEQYQQNYEKLKEKQKYYKDRVFPTPDVDKKPAVFADYKNAPGTNMPLSDETDNYCCKGFSDKPPENKYKATEALPDIDFICDYIRKIITSCNENLRMLTPRPTIRPRIRATDIDKLCYCRETNWPQGNLAERFRREAQGGPCPVCTRELDRKERAGTLENPIRTFDIANIRGPCGRHDCRIARDMRDYIQKLVDEDNKEINLEDIIGPCGSKTCTLVDRIHDFLRHRGPFSHEAAADANTLPGLATQCACTNILQKSFMRKGSCDSVCSFDCETNSSEYCGGKICPYRKEPGSKPDSKSTSPQSSKSDLKSNPQKVYQVLYFTVEYDKSPTPSKSEQTPQSPAAPQSPAVSTKASTDAYKHCASECPNREQQLICSKEVCPAPEWSGGQKTATPPCENTLCPRKEAAEPQKSQISPADSQLVIALSDIKNPCCVKTCEVAETVKEFIVRGWTQKAKPKSCITDDPCYCDCTCLFKMSGKTTYCPLCGGYELLGDDMREMPAHIRPHPCPIYHKMYNRNALKTTSPWPEENKVDEATIAIKSVRSSRRQSVKSVASSLKSNNEQEMRTPTTKQVKKRKAKKPVIEIKTTAVQEAAGEKRRPSWMTIEPVPRYMGWNWKAKDIPGLKVRPKWRPGAANKILVRRYRAVREGVDIIAKKKRALLGKKKKLELKPTLVVTKKDGEYTVQMEVFKKYSKDRLLYQYPYEEKPPLIYTIGKTDETKAKIQKQRERRERRETRRKNRLLQSTFRDKCQEICLKAYNQSIGLLPLPNPNNPDCPCDVPAVKLPQGQIVDSCSCSESGSISSSDTDGDEWTIEFSPPLAMWDTNAKHAPIVSDGTSQYNYLDYKVKIPDKFGYAVPRYFIGPDGKKVCSDLGGFWGPGHKWLEINSDAGYVACDNRWVPSYFIGADGIKYGSDEGFFVDASGNSYKIGVDGYVDVNNRWCFYPNKRRADTRKSMSTVGGKAAAARQAASAPAASAAKPSAAKPSAALPQKKPATTVAGTDKDKSQKKTTTFKTNKGMSVMNVSTSNQWFARKNYNVEQQLAKAVVSNTGQMKGIDPISPRVSFRSSIESKIMKYKEIMMPDSELRPPTKTSRACSTHQVFTPAIGTMWGASLRQRSRLTNSSELSRNFIDR